MGGGWVGSRTGLDGCGKCYCKNINHKLTIILNFSIRDIKEISVEEIRHLLLSIGLN
jgi:hypothetical protein